MAKKKPVRAGIVGCGAISPAHFRSYRACGIEVVAVCDTNRGLAESRKDEYGDSTTRVFTRHQDLLKIPEIDFVTVATPVAFHAPIAIDALRAGKHVACEKPSALTLRENRAIVREAKKAGRKVIFFSSRLRYGMVTLARKYINGGELGDIYHVEVQHYRRRSRPGVDTLPHATWFINRRLAGGGVIMDLGQYFMDVVLDLIGWPTIKTVSATTFRGFPHSLPRDVVFDVEEHCTFLARGENRLTLTLDLAWIANHSTTRRIAILGTKGGIRMDDTSAFTYFSDKGGPWHWMNTTTEWHDKRSGADHIYSDFVDAIRGKDPGVGTTPEQALALTELTKMAMLSAKRGREVTRSDLKGIE